MKHALIMTVGVGGQNPDSLIGALAGSVQRARADVVAFIHSKENKEIAEKVRDQSGHTNETVYWKVDDISNIDSIFNRIIELIEHIETSYDLPASQQSVDFTSGTKAMSAACALAAASMGVPEFHYIAGQREGGVVKSGMEVYQSAKIPRVNAFNSIHSAIAELAGLRYESAIQRAEQASDHALIESYAALKVDIIHLAKGYQHWDLFAHSAAKDEFNAVQASSKKVDRFAFPKNMFHRLIKMSDSLKNKKASSDILSDLFNNASRRILEGKYDDAAARLYRLTEMIAQNELAKLGIDTGNVKREDVTDGYYNKFKGEFSGKDGEAKLGLHKSYELLQAKRIPLGDSFMNNNTLRHCLSMRNNSILAHGSTPISKELCENLRSEVLKLAQQVDSDFDQRCNDLQFPWLRE